jgi:hypothetical protein
MADKINIERGMLLFYFICFSLRVTFYDNLMEFKYFCEGNSAFMGHGMW